MGGGGNGVPISLLDRNRLGSVNTATEMPVAQDGGFDFAKDERGSGGALETARRKQWRGPFAKGYGSEAHPSLRSHLPPIERAERLPKT